MLNILRMADQVPSKRRFVDVDREEVLLGKYAKKTDYSTNYAFRLLEQFLNLRNLKLTAIENINLDSELGTFYTRHRKEDGQHKR